MTTPGKKKTKYAAQSARTAGRKATKAKKVIAKKKEWIEKDVKKNGKAVKGGASHKKRVAKIEAERRLPEGYADGQLPTVSDDMDALNTEIDEVDGEDVEDEESALEGFPEEV